MNLPFPTIAQSEQSRVQSSFRFRNPEERQLHAWVNAEVEDYIDYARPAREFGSDAIQGYMSVVHRSVGRKDRSDITFPLLHATIYSRMQIEAAQAPKMKFKARTEADKPNMQWIELSIKHAQKGGYNKPPVDHVYFEQTFDKNLLGVGAVHVGFEFQTRQVKVRNASTGKVEEKIVTVYDDIRERNIDFFNFGVSRDMKPGMFDGMGAYWDEFYDEVSFYDKFGNNPFYENVSRDMIPDGDWFMGAAAGSVPKPRQWKGIYRVRRFYHLGKDLFYVQANGIPIRTDFILDYGDPTNPKKMIPIATTHNDIAYEHHRQSALNKFAVQNNRFYDASSNVNTNKSFWSKPESLIVKPMIAAQNTFGRAAIDWLKAANVHFVMGPSAVIERINKGKLYGIEPIKLDAGDFNTKSLVQGSTFLQDFRVADDYLSKISHAALGRDITRVARENPPQATVAAMEREMEKQRDAQNNRYNSTGGMLRKAWLYYILVKQYYPQPRAVKVNDVGQIEDVDEYRILRDADGRPVLQLEPKMIDVGSPVVEVVDEKHVKVKDADGNERTNTTRKYRLLDPNHSAAIESGKSAQNYITLREDYFVTEADPEIEIEPLSSFQEESALQKAVAVEQLQAIQPFLTMVKPDGSPVLPPEGINYIMQNIAHAFGWDVDKLMGMLSSDNEETREDEDPAPPAYQDPADLGVNGMMPGASAKQMAPNIDPQMASEAIQQTAPTGTPPAAGKMLNTNAALASAIAM